MDIRLNSIFPELSSIESFIDSDEQFDMVMDSVIGKLPDYLKGIYTLLQLAKQSMRQAVIKARDINYSDEEIANNIYGAHEAAEKYKTIRSLFILISGNEFGLRGEKYCTSLGVRKGFLLVKPANYEPERIFLRGTPEEIIEQFERINIQRRFCKN